MRGFIALTGAIFRGDTKGAGEPLRGTRGLRQAGWFKAHAHFPAESEDSQ